MGQIFKDTSCDIILFCLLNSDYYNFLREKKDLEVIEFGQFHALIKENNTT